MYVLGTYGTVRFGTVLVATEVTCPTSANPKGPSGPPGPRSEYLFGTSHDVQYIRVVLLWMHIGTSTMQQYQSVLHTSFTL